MSLSQQYDSLFKRYGTDRYGIPVSYLRSLAKRESDFNLRSGEDRPIGGARGLLQVTDDVRQDYNTKHGTNWTIEDMFEPEKNIKVATYLLSKILDAFEDVALKPDWTSSRWVELFTFAWNAGWTPSLGVPRVIGLLEKNGYDRERITVELVRKTAEEMKRAGIKIGKHLDRNDKMDWSKGVTSLYFKERYFRERGINETPRSNGSNSGWGLVLGGLILLGITAALLKK